MTSPVFRLGTASWMEGARERRALVAELPSDASRLVDLNRMEQFRLARLGEGASESLADALVPPSLRRVLEGGPRALQRVRQALAYAEKWHRRGDLPESLAVPIRAVRLHPCVPRPAVLRRADGAHLDRLRIQGSGGTLGTLPRPTLAIAGLHRSSVTGWCLAVEDAAGAALGSWMLFEVPEDGVIEFTCGSQAGQIPLDAWGGLDLPAARPGEVILLPPPQVQALSGLVPGAAFSVGAGFDVLHLRLDREMAHTTVQ